MKLRHTIYNSIGLALAGLYALGLARQIILLMLGHSVRTKHPVEFVVIFIMEVLVVAFVGGGGLTNLANGRLQRKPTLMMIITYCVTVVFLPLGIWGLYELETNEKKRRRHREGENRGRTESSTFSTTFLRRAATLSWVFSVGGLVILFLLYCASPHNRPLVSVSILIYLVMLILSLILGIVALCGVREHGKPGILIPSIFGISVSALILLFCVTFITIGFLQVERRARLAGAAATAVASQTNAAPYSTPN